jgi:porphobilinogen synthase
VSFKRFRRVRINPQIREMLTETRLSVSDFIYPLFIRDGKGIKNEVASMPGVYQMSIDEVIKEIKVCQNMGINSFMLFGIPTVKDSIGSDALCEHGIIAEALKAIKNACPTAMITTDLCFCEYTDHGHCGIMNTKLQTVDNDATLEILARQAVIHAKHGVDMIAPSGMMDGTIEVLRVALDNAGYSHLPLMAYSTKFASAYYGPFRDVAESAPSFGDRRSYQMNPANRLEAIEESLEDEKQGADILMVKPALAYLDIIRDIRERTNTPIAAYNVSGEYAMLKMAGKMGLIDYDRAMMETLVSIKRAGAGIIISYHAKEAAVLING